jgi:hypothetical protein
MPKNKKTKQQNISINTGEPIEEKDLDMNPAPVLDPLSGLEDDEKKDDDELDIDDDDIDPFKDKWEE